MKRFAIFLSFLLLFCSCKEDGPVDITGDWQLTDMTLTKSVQIGTEEVDIYISFAADNTFGLWQFLGAGRYEHFDGTWALAEDVLTGKYSDGSAWGNAYNVSLEGDLLTLEATQNSSDVYIYKRTTIPEDIK